jgi:multiple sugar transport system ATP-binding protein
MGRGSQDETLTSFLYNPPPMGSLTIRNLTKRYPGTQSGLFDFSLDVEPGEHLVIAGPSGAGKTTLLRLIAGLEIPDAGQIAIAGNDVTNWPPRKRNLSLVAQRPAIYPHLTVRRNLSMSVELRRDFVSRPQLQSRVQDAATLLGLTPLLDRRADKLSGGEQQRVALGRAWVAQTHVWLLDEPFAHLDPTLRTAIRAELHLLRGRSKATILEVTHDPGDALASGRRVAVLRAGRLEQVGPADELYARPASRTVAAALGAPAINFADGVVISVDGHLAMQMRHGATVPLPVVAAAGRAGSGDRVCLAVRPENLVTAAGGDGIVPLGEWNIVRSVAHGPAWLATVEQSDLVWQAWLPEQLKSGSIPLAARREQVLVFDGNGARIWPGDRETQTAGFLT